MYAIRQVVLQAFVFTLSGSIFVKRFLENCSDSSASINLYHEKNYLPLIFFAGILCFLFAFAEKGKDPKSVALNFLNAYKVKDYTKAKKFATEETIKLLDMQDAAVLTEAEKKSLGKIKVAIKKVEEDGASCEVTYTYSSEPEDEKTLLLLKTGDKWLVSLTKEDVE